MFQKNKSLFLVSVGNPERIFEELFVEFEVKAVFAGIDYEPYSVSRDNKIKDLCRRKGVRFHSFHDHVVFNPSVILKNDQSPYHVFTPFSKRWLLMYESGSPEIYPSEAHLDKLLKHAPADLPSTHLLRIEPDQVIFPSGVIDEQLLVHYHETRDFPAIEGTSRLGLHLRFGTISIRKLVRTAWRLNRVFLNELIWREFYQMILFHHPEVVTRSFRPGYDRVQWLNNPGDFEAWCEGRTGYPLVDAGMHELVETGFMHNRVRMVTASFLTKHLLIDWRWGEAFFAQYLLDYELASNNGGWQWAAGSGCDAVPYFRVFNPSRQQETYDPAEIYIKKWIPGYISAESYISPIVDHTFARERAIAFLKIAQRG